MGHNYKGRDYEEKKYAYCTAVFAISHTQPIRKHANAHTESEPERHESKRTPPGDSNDGPDDTSQPKTKKRRPNPAERRRNLQAGLTGSGAEQSTS